VFFKSNVLTFIDMFQSLNSKISDESDKFLLNYSNLFWGPLSFWTQCRSVPSSRYP